MSKRLLTLTCVLAVAAASCGSIPNGTVEPGSGTRFVPQVADFVDDAGLGNQVVTNADGVPFISYWIFPAVLAAGALPVTRPIGAPYIHTLATTTAPPQDGGAVAVASLGANGIWTKGAAAQVQDDPPGITVPYGPATDPNLIGATAANTNGTSMAIDASGNMDVAWTGRNGVYYASAPSTGGFQVQRLFNYGYSLTLAGPMSRPSVAVDGSGTPWVAYTVVANGVEVRVATKKGDSWTTTTVADTKCTTCPNPPAPKIVVTPQGPLVAYADAVAHTLDVARLTKGKWVTQTVASGVSAEGLSLAAGKDGTGYLSYYDGNGAVQLATTGATSWSVAKVADAAPPPSPSGSVSASPAASAPTGGNFEPTTGVAVDDSGNVWVTWYDGAIDRVVLASVQGGTVTPLPTQDTQGGAYPSLAANADGSKVYLSWYAKLDQDLLLGIQGDVSGQAIGVVSPLPSGVSGPTVGTCGKGAPILLNQVAQNTSFENTCLVAPAGKNFAINFDNTDSGLIHNIAVSKSSTYSSFIFTGSPVTGPNKVVYNVTQKSGPLPVGIYYFRCDYHPTQMFGVLAVVKSSG